MSMKLCCISHSQTDHIARDLNRLLYFDAVNVSAGLQKRDGKLQRQHVGAERGTREDRAVWHCVQRQWRAFGGFHPERPHPL